MASYYNPRISTNNLGFYFDAANSKCWTNGIIGSGDPQTLFTFTGDNRMTLEKGAAYAQVSFASGGSVHLQGANNEYIGCGNPSNSFDLGNTSFTISVGFRAASFVQNSILVSKGGNSWKIIRNGVQNTFNFYTNGLSEVSTITTSTFSPGTNYVMTCVYNQSTSQKLIYINGLIDKTTNSVTGSLTTNSNNFFIGESDENGLSGSPLSVIPTGASWDGYIYFTQIYNRALNAEEIYNNFNAVKGRLRL